MGQRGSDVSREVADLVLLDDNFATIVSAVEEGRGIYENIQKFLRFLFSTNLSEVLLVAGGAVVAFAIDLRDETGGLMLPLTAAQILWINLLTDGLPALALAFDRTPGVMQQKPTACRLAVAGPALCPVRRRRREHEGRARIGGARSPSDVRLQPRGHARRRVSLHGRWTTVPDLPVAAHVDAASVEPRTCMQRWSAGLASSSPRHRCRSSRTCWEVLRFLWNCGLSSLSLPWGLGDSRSSCRD